LFAFTDPFRVAPDVVSVVAAFVVTDGTDAIVYIAVPTALCVKPEAMAMALIVSEAETIIGPLYRVDEVLGVLPLVV